MIERFIDDDNKVYILPKKKKNRIEVLSHFADHFENDCIYSEKEINDIINKLHSFNDVCIIRRELIEYKFLTRTDDCKEYKKINREIKDDSYENF